MTKIIEEDYTTSEKVIKPNILISKISNYQNNLIDLTRVTKKLESIANYLDGAKLSKEDEELNENVPATFYEQFDMLNDDLNILTTRLYSVLNRITEE